MVDDRKDDVKIDIRFFFDVVHAFMARVRIIPAPSKVTNRIASSSEMRAALRSTAAIVPLLLLEATLSTRLVIVGMVAL